MTVCGEKVTGVCVAGKCPHFKRCHPIVWDKYGKIKPKTNEEYLKSCNTEQLADAIYECTMANSWSFNKDGIKKWLKQPHTIKE